ncbi:hypothetical protein NTJ12_001518 [Flavobacterium psychrophilum]|nr:hypothetical protein [Flavobacterium psychrophilum]
MKKLIFTLLIISASFTSNLFAQNLKKDCEFYKSTTYILYTLNTVNEFTNSKEKDLEKVLPILESNNIKIQKSFNILKLKYSKDKDFKQYENYVLFSKNVGKMLQENYEGLALGLYLLNDDLTSFLN